MKACEGGRGVAPQFLTSTLDGVVHFTAKKGALGTHLDGRLNEPLSRSGRCGEQKNLALPRIEPRTAQAVVHHYTHQAILLKTSQVKQPADLIKG
jgi:hypothetical protein